MMALNIFSPTWEIQDSYGRIARSLDSYASAFMHVNRFGYAAEPGVIVPSFGGLLLGYPTIYPSFPMLSQHGKRVAVTMFESNRIPDSWIWVLDSVDEIVVPSAWLVDVFRESGVEKPVHVAALGVSEAFKNARRAWDEDRPFTVIAIADRGERKGWDRACYAFHRAFGRDERYKLILKCRAGSTKYFPFSRIDNPNIELIDKDFTDEEMAALYTSCDVMLFLSCGEGFGLPPREFAATGGISIVTAWSGLKDDLDQWGIGVPYALTRAWQNDPKNYDIGEWANADIDAAAERLKEIASWDRDYRLAVGARFAEFARRYDWNAFAKTAVDVWSA